MLPPFSMLLPMLSLLLQRSLMMCQPPATAFASTSVVVAVAVAVAVAVDAALALLNVAGDECSS